MYFRNEGHAKRLLHKYLKSAVSQFASTSNMVNAPKHIPNSHGSTFIILTDHR